MGTLGFEDSDVKSLLLLKRVFRAGVDRTGQYLDIEPDLRHAPLTISESGCNTNTEAVSTPREKLQDKLVLDGRRSPTLKKDEATRCSSACMRLSYLAQATLDLAETTKHFTQRMSEPREFDFAPLKRAARYPVGKAPSSAGIPKTETCWQDHSLRGQRLCWRPSLEEEHGIGSSVTTLWNLDQRFRAWHDWALEKRSFTQWWKEIKLDYPWDLCIMI